MESGVYDAKKVENYAKETEAYKDLQKAKESSKPLASSGGVSKWAGESKLPNNYSEFSSSAGAMSSANGGLAEGYRRVVNDISGEIKILGPDGKIYNEVQGKDGLTTLQHLSYEAAPYHGTTNNVVKNKAPSFGQEALDLSIQIKETSTRRIGIDYKNQEFVVFDNTIANTYHGHVRSWQELTQEMKNSLIKNGIVDKKGQIIKR